MESLRFFQIFVFFIASSFLISPSSAAIPTSALFAFGDGLYDIGNNAHLNPNNQYNLHPYGVDTDDGATGRPSNGHLVVDFIADYSNLHQRVRAYLANVTAEWQHGVSFATAGAIVNADDKNYDISTQLDEFEDVVVTFLTNKYGAEETNKLLSNSIYLLTFGTKEYLSLGHYVEAGTLIETIDQVIAAYKAAIIRIYKLGGRKFGFQNIGPLRQMPYFKNLYNASSCDVEYKPVAQWHNIMLEDTLHHLATCQQDGSPWLEGFKYAYFDYYSVLANLNNSFTNGSDACCGSGKYNGEMTCAIEDESVEYNLCSDRSQYVWFDGVHPSHDANKIIAEQFWIGSTNVVRPYNLAELIASITPPNLAKRSTSYVSV